MERQIPLLTYTRDLEARRHPERTTDLNQQLTESRKQWEERQHKGRTMLQVAKMEVDFKRKKHNLIQEAVSAERKKWQEQRADWDRQKEEEFEERRRNWTELTDKELLRQR